VSLRRDLVALPRAAWLLAATTLVNRTGTMIMSFLVLYLVREQDVGATTAGLIVAAYGIGGIVGSPIAGRLCDRFGGVIVLQSSLAAAGVLALGMYWMRGVVGWMAIVFAFGVAAESLWPANLMLVTHAVTPGQRKFAFALLRLAGNLGASIGPLIGGLLAHEAFRGVFIVDGATSILAALIVVASIRRARPPVAPDTEAAPPAPAPKPGSRRIDLALAYFCLAMFPALVVFYQQTSTMLLYITGTLGATEAFYGLLFTINTILILTIELPLTSATAHWRHRNALALGALLVGIGFGALAFATSAIALCATVVAWTFGEMLILPAGNAYVADIAPADRKGEYMGIYNALWGLVVAVAPPLGIFVLTHHGTRALWLGALAAGCASAVLLLRGRERPTTS
jgi:MFS family permease